MEFKNIRNQNKNSKIKWIANKYTKKLGKVSKSVVLKLMKQVLKGSLCIMLVLNSFDFEFQTFLHLFIHKHIKTVVTFPRD